VKTFPEALSIIIANLLDNAIRYGGQEPRRIVTASIIDGGWQLCIIDNGPGILAEHQPFIFNRFYRLPSGDRHEVKGYGIGLAQVKTLLLKMNGQIRLDSNPVKGITFTLTFKC